MTDDSINLDESTRYLSLDPLRSLTICQNYLTAHPNDPSGLFSRFQAWMKLGELQRALEDINRVLKIDPNCGGYSSRAQLLRMMGNHLQAVEDLTHARELDEKEWLTSYDPHLRADSLARLGRLGEALADCSHIPDDHWMPGVLGLPRGNKQDFIEEIKRRAKEARRQSRNIRR